jgi:DNA-binding XRE family transcriptional regulator
MNKIIKIFTEDNLEKIKLIFRRLSTIESRFENNETLATEVAESFKHTTEDIWWFYYDDVYNNMGDKGKELIIIILNDLIDSKFLQIEEVNLINEGYLIINTEE